MKSKHRHYYPIIYNHCGVKHCGISIYGKCKCGKPKEEV